MKRWSSVLVVLIVAVSLVVPNLVGPSMVNNVQAAGGEGHFGLPAGGIDHLDPALWYFTTTWRLAFATCTPLVTFPDAEGEAGKQVVGGLADLPEVSEDGTTYTFTLKPGIKFADGTPITAEDIKYTWERMFAEELASPAVGFFTDIVGAEAFLAGEADEISGIQVDGDAITFELVQPGASFLKRMTMPFTCPVPKGTPATPFEDGELLISGPYMVESYDPSQQLVLTRNPNFASDVLGDRGKLDRIVIDIGVDAAQAGLMIRAGQLDAFLENLPAADASQAVDDASLEGRVFTTPRGEILYLWMNLDVPPFDNVKVRQAVNYAINRNAILRVWGGPSQAMATDQVLPPTMSGWVDTENYPMSGDPEKAKALLAESGLDLPIETTLRTRNDAPGYLEVSQAVQAQLKDVGINVNIESALDSVNSAYIKTRANLAPSGINSWSQDYPDPDNFIDALLDGTRITETNNQNQGNFDNAEINEEIASLAGVTGEARDTAYHALDAKIIGEHAPWAPLLNPIRVDVIAERVTAYPVHPIYGPDLAAIEIEE